MMNNACWSSWHKTVDDSANVKEVMCVYLMEWTLSSMRQNYFVSRGNISLNCCPNYIKVKDTHLMLRPESDEITVVVD